MVVDFAVTSKDPICLIRNYQGVYLQGYQMIPGVEVKNMKEARVTGEVVEIISD